MCQSGKCPYESGYSGDCYYPDEPCRLMQDDLDNAPEFENLQKCDNNDDKYLEA